MRSKVAYMMPLTVKMIENSLLSLHIGSSILPVSKLHRILSRVQFEKYS